MKSPRREGARCAAVLVWIIALLIGEIGVFWRAGQCQKGLSSPSGLSHDDNGNRAVVAVIADPQLTDSSSYGQRPGSLGLWLTEFYSDLFMRRAFRSLMRLHEPNKVVFLGDLFDGGRTADDYSYIELAERFQSIFGSDWRKFLFMAGNHDVGLGRYFSSQAEKHFRDVFGQRSHAQGLCKKHLVMIDSPSLVNAAHQNRDDTVALREAMSTIQQIPEGSDTILFSHIPLWREPGVSCDSSMPRQKQQLQQGFGPSYQNLLNAQYTSMLLLHTQAGMIFSGDDHDFCVVNHDVPGRNNAKTAREFTVASFSWLQGVRHPGYALLSISGCKAPAGQQSVEVDLCSLHDQLHVYFHYVVLAAATIIVLGCDSLMMRSKAMRDGSKAHKDGDLLTGTPEDVTSPVSEAKSTSKNTLRARMSHSQLLAAVEAGDHTMTDMEQTFLNGDTNQTSLPTREVSGFWHFLSNVRFVACWGLSVYIVLLFLF